METVMDNPEFVVRKLFAGLALEREKALPIMLELLHPEFVWENIGYSRTVGFRDMPKAFADFESRFQFRRMSIDIRTLVVSGNKVLNERIDHFHRADDSIALSAPVMGIMVVEEGKITEWRDYCDFALFREFPAEK